MSHLHQVNNRGGSYFQISTAAPFNLSTDFVGVSSFAHLLSDARYRYANHHDPRSMSTNHAASNHFWSRDDSVFPSRTRGNNSERPPRSFRHPQVLPHYGQESIESFIGSGYWNRQDETMILNGNTSRTNWSREDDVLILDGSMERVESDNSRLSEAVISKYLRTRKGKRVIEDDQQVCVVCQDDLFNENQRIATLECRHEYHASCIVAWLKRKNVCPLCNSTALPSQ